MKMINLRPQVSPQQLSRPRLARQLPDTVGHVVWLEAPYGYGKSVLAAEWARTLETQGWRVLWLTPTGFGVHGAVARALDYPPDTPWPLLQEALWHTPTLLVLEDLDGSEALSALLKSPQGLILLASRRRLPEPELPRLRAEGRLLHLTAHDLAFTRAEAAALFRDSELADPKLADPELAERQWARTLGWPLPLQLAALTGCAPGDLASPADLQSEAAALLDGMQQSLEPAAWDEVLLLSSVQVLPNACARPFTRQVVQAGFAQALQDGVRLHPLSAELLLGLHRAEVQRVVVREAKRLPLLLRGEAFEHSGLTDHLADLLEVDPDLGEAHAETVLRWDALAAGERGVVRRCSVGDALGFQRREREAAELLHAAATTPGNTAEQTLFASRKLIWWLMEQGDLTRARAVIQDADPLLTQVDAVSASRFLNDASRLHFELGEYELGEQRLNRALTLLEVGHPRRAALMMNLGLFRYYHHGDLEARLTLFETVLDDPRLAAQVGASRSVSHYDLGRQWLLLGDRGRASAHFRQALTHGHSNPAVRLVAQGCLDVLSGTLEPVQGLLTQLQRWERFAYDHQLRSLAARHLIRLGRFQEALALALASPPGTPQQAGSWPLMLAAQALALSGLGRHAEARSMLEAPAGDNREVLLYWHAARFRVLRDPADLDALLSQTLLGARLLPALVPLADLPPQRPELSEHYPLDEVLHSGWQAAIRRRLPDLPALELRLLGGVEVRVLGQHIALPPRPRDLLVLLALGHTREEAATALWPDLEAADVRNNLNYSLSTLRRALEPWGGATYLTATGLSRVHSDLDDLHAALAAADGPAVLDLYRGDLAAGIDLPAADDLRERLRAEVVDCLGRLAVGAAPEQAEAYLERALTLDPDSAFLADELRRVLTAQGREHYALKRHELLLSRTQQVVLEGLPAPSDL